MKIKNLSQRPKMSIKLFVKAEGILAFNGPVMMLVVYGCIICIILVWSKIHCSWKYDNRGTDFYV